MTFKDFLEDILIVVVLYKKKISECESLLTISNALADQFIDIFVYDNSPEYNFDPAAILENHRLHYIADYENSGVSKAYNIGANRAQNMNKRWLLLCDQDTVFTRSYFEQVFITVDIHNPLLMAPFLFSHSTLISPCGFMYNYGYALNKQPISGWNNFKNSTLLNSGLFITCDAFEECGGYNEKVFLDFSDFDFMKRYRNKYSQFYLLDVKLEHHLESSTQNFFNESRFIKYCKSYRGAIHNFFYLIISMMFGYRKRLKFFITK